MRDILFLDQTGQLGGAELCLADMASLYRSRCSALLLDDGPFASLLRERGVDTEVLPLPPALAGLRKKASLAAMAAALPALPLFLAQLRRRIRSHRLLYMNTPKALIQGTLAAIGTRRPMVYHLHDILDASHFSALNIRALVTAANRSRLVIANSRATAAAFTAAGGRSTLRVIPNGFDPAPFDAVTPDQAASLQASFSAPGHTVAAIFGRIAPWKGQHLLIDAAGRIPHLTVWIVGEPLFTQEDRDYAASLRTRAASLADRVHFLGFRRDIPALMRAADIVVNCSVSAEPFGRVIVEGMLASRPVVAPAAGGPAEIIAPDASGLLFAPGDAASLASALRRLSLDPSLREAMGRAGRARAISHFSLDAVRQLTVEALAPFLP